jgi:transcriptional regulator GlxA family with amidase domain
MTAHLDQPHTLLTLASLIELCPRQLERLFKEGTGNSPLQYLHDLRLTRACDLLVTSFKNVTEIAEAVGFDNVNYFIRVFKAACGCTPLVFRKRSAGATVAKKIA